MLIACEPTAEGVLSAIGLAYLAHLDASTCRLARADAYQPTLLETVYTAPADYPLAQRVLDGFERTCARGCPKSRSGGCARCSGNGTCVRRIAYACASDSPTMPEVVHRYVRTGFAHGARLRNMRSHPDVTPMEDMARGVSAECEKARQFARFSRMSDGSFLSVYRPKANVIPFVASYFAARMGDERWALVDPVHQMAALHDGQLVVARLDAELAAQAAARDDLAEDEHYVRSLWKLFFDRLSLGGRSPSERGYDLQAQLMPHRVRMDMPEFDPRNDDPGQEPSRYREASSAHGRLQKG